MKSIPNQQLDAFVDGQLDQNDRIEILDAMGGSGEIRNQVAETRRLKDLVRRIKELSQNDRPSLRQNTRATLLPLCLGHYRCCF